MNQPLITSLTNPLIKKTRTLRQRKVRAETGLFIVEGLHHVGEALEAGWNIDSILYSPDLLTSDFGRDLISHITPAAQPVSAQVMESLADKDNPQGILAVVHQRLTRLDNLGSVRIGAAVVSPQDAGNVGTILRTLDAVGADVLFLLDGGVDPYHPTSVRASMGTIFWKPIVQTSFNEFIIWSRGFDHQLIATSAHSQQNYLELKPNAPWILLLGSEQKGLLPEQIKACDVSVSLPMRGRASSLNLAVAAGILLYQFTVA
jgi:RNA methyltransferase, TrmH family